MAARFKSLIATVLLAVTVSTSVSLAPVPAFFTILTIAGLLALLTVVSSLNPSVIHYLAKWTIFPIWDQYRLWAHKIHWSPASFLSQISIAYGLEADYKDFPLPIRKIHEENRIGLISVFLILKWIIHHCNLSNNEKELFIIFWNVIIHDPLLEYRDQTPFRIATHYIKYVMDTWEEPWMTLMARDIKVRYEGHNPLLANSKILLG